MSKEVILVSAALTATLACGPQPATSGASTTGSEATVAVVWPVGDVGAGRQAFIDLKCTTCHAVVSEPDFPRPVSANPGPTLGPARPKVTLRIWPQRS
jgi:hypothetical protein